MKDQAFLSFIQRERQRLINYVKSLLIETSELDAEDIVHDVLVKLIERPNSTASLDNVAAYVYRSLRNRVIDRARTRRPTVSIDEDNDVGSLGEALADVAPNAPELLQTHQGRQKLFEALATLSDIERNVVIAHEFEGTTFREMAEMWDVPQNTLLSHKSRALKKLRRRFMNA